MTCFKDSILVKKFLKSVNQVTVIDNVNSYCHKKLKLKRSVDNNF